LDDDDNGGDGDDTQFSFINMLILTALWQIIKLAQHKCSTPTAQQSSNTI
jgi:hypothetical protein